jgi:hypothetical protein
LLSGKRKFPPNKVTRTPDGSECVPVLLQVFRDWQMSGLCSLVFVLCIGRSGCERHQPQRGHVTGQRSTAASVVEIYTDSPSVDFSCISEPQMML